MLLQVILSGLATGSIYALVALGLALIYNTTEHVNFAQGEMSIVSAFIGFTFLIGSVSPFLWRFCLH